MAPSPSFCARSTEWQHRNWSACRRTVRTWSRRCGPSGMTDDPPLDVGHSVGHWKAEVNARLPSDTTPQFAAVAVQSPACVRLLLQSGGQPVGFFGRHPDSSQLQHCPFRARLSMLLSTPETNHPVVPRRDIFELVAPTMSRQAIGFSSSCCMYGCGGPHDWHCAKFLSAFR